MRRVLAVAIGILVIVCSHQARHHQAPVRIQECRSTIGAGDPEAAMANQLIAYETGGFR
jgi:hypothetical protein